MEYWETFLGVPTGDPIEIHGSARDEPRGLSWKAPWGKNNDFGHDFFWQKRASRRLNEVKCRPLV